MDLYTEGMDSWPEGSRKALELVTLDHDAQNIPHESSACSLTVDASHNIVMN